MNSYDKPAQKIIYKQERTTAKKINNPRQSKTFLLPLIRFYTVLNWIKNISNHLFKSFLPATRMCAPNVGQKHIQKTQLSQQLIVPTLRRGIKKINLAERAYTRTLPKVSNLKIDFFVQSRAFSTNNKPDSEPKFCVKSLILRFKKWLTYSEPLSEYFTTVVIVSFVTFAFFVAAEEFGFVVSAETIVSNEASLFSYQLREKPCFIGLAHRVLLDPALYFAIASILLAWKFKNRIARLCAAVAFGWFCYRFCFHYEVVSILTQRYVWKSPRVFARIMWDGSFWVSLIIAASLCRESKLARTDSQRVYLAPMTLVNAGYMFYVIAYYYNEEMHSARWDNVLSQYKITSEIPSAFWLCVTDGYLYLTGFVALFSLFVYLLLKSNFALLISALASLSFIFQINLYYNDIAMLEEHIKHVAEEVLRRKLEAAKPPELPFWAYKMKPFPKHKIPAPKIFPKPKEPPYRK